MKVSNWLISLILFSLIVVGGSTVLLDSAEKYSLSVADNGTAQYDKVEDISGIAYDSSDKLRGSAVEDESSDQTIIKSAWGSLKNVLNSYTQAKDLITVASDEIGIPDFIYLGILSIVLIMITFALFSLIFKKDA